MKYAKVFEEVSKDTVVFTIKEEGKVIKEFTSLANVEDIDMVTSAIYAWLRNNGYEPVFSENEEDWSDSGVIDYWQHPQETVEQFQERCK